FYTLNDTLDWLYQQKKQQRREDLSRIQKCIELLEIKTDYFKIHIAGTNGKGSTAMFLKKLLEQRGKKVGVFTSPYVLCFNERIAINDEFIRDEEIIHYCNKLYDFSINYQKKYQDTIPFFELTFLMALMYFEDCDIDTAVIECGLGGRLDATNVLKTDIQVITNISLEHQQQLGSTLESIAWHKLGITEEGYPCFTAVDESLYSYFKTYAEEHKVSLYYVTPDVKNIVAGIPLRFQYQNECYQTSLNATYQAYNASLAIAVIKYLNLGYTKKEINQVLLNMTYPARFEELIPNVLLDGAHNIKAIDALLDSLRKTYKEKNFSFVFTALKDKDIVPMIHLLDSEAHQFYFTTLEDKRAVDLEFFHDLTSKPCEFFLDYEEAICKAIKDRKENELVVITGSLHFVS
ncbi:MAG: hypothetical protein K2O05_03530, partial [Anaeroplasmataceae bacterium]|nr:hypothetical protein [Anaeroplasmataceae bacterium]